MTLKESLINEIGNTLNDRWTEDVAIVVPSPENILLNDNHAKLLEKAVVLYADLDGSTSMVDKSNWYFSAEIYKCYLRAASQIIKSEGGQITAYDGDRVMAIFTGKTKNTAATRAGLKINSAVLDIIRPAIDKYYPTNTFVLKHVIGIASSDLHAVRIGVRGDNDITWVGSAANHAAKLTELSEKPIWITKAVYDSLAKEAKFSNGQNMWSARTWTRMNNMNIYCSVYKWSL